MRNSYQPRHPLLHHVSATIEGLRRGAALVRNHRRLQMLSIVLAASTHTVLVFTTNVYAQNSVGDTATRAWQQIYDNWRGPISIFALIIGAALLMFTGRNAHHWIIKIVIAVVLFALAPELYKTFTFWARG